MTQQGCFTIKKEKIRGQESHGMICAEDELGLGASDGIMILDDPMLQEQKRQRYLK
jgi:phenylalanyl-tRNA synthetase beta chain